MVNISRGFCCSEKCFYETHTVFNKNLWIEIRIERFSEIFQIHQNSMATTEILSG